MLAIELKSSNKSKSVADIDLTTCASSSGVGYNFLRAVMGSDDLLAKTIEMATRVYATARKPPTNFIIAAEFASLKEIDVAFGSLADLSGMSDSCPLCLRKQTSTWPSVQP